jgi:hypothetical protein
MFQTLAPKFEMAKEKFSQPSQAAAEFLSAESFLLSMV